MQTDDAYGHGPVERSVTPVRGLIRSGNSGGPVLTPRRSPDDGFREGARIGPPSGYGVAGGPILAALDRALEGRGTPGSGGCAGG